MLKKFLFEKKNILKFENFCEHIKKSSFEKECTIKKNLSEEKIFCEKTNFDSEDLKNNLELLNDLEFEKEELIRIKNRLKKSKRKIINK